MKKQVGITIFICSAFLFKFLFATGEFVNQTNSIVTFLNVLGKRFECCRVNETFNFE